MSDETTFTVAVTLTAEEVDDDEYVIDQGYVPVVSTTADRELWIHRRKPGGGKDEFVAVYAQGQWVCCWLNEEPPTPGAIQDDVVAP